MTKSFCCSVLVSLSALANPKPAVDHRHLMLPFDVSLPGASETSAFGVNNEGVVVGDYLASDGTGHGFMFKDGQFVDVVPNESGVQFTELTGISNSGDAVGDYVDAAGIDHAFLRRADGTIVKLPDPPGAVYNQPRSINLQGVIVGLYATASDCVGYVYWAGTYHRLDLGLGPTSCAEYPEFVPQPLGINDRGQIVGSFFDARVFQHGFLVSPRPCGYDACTDYGPRYEEITIDGLPTSPWAINNRGEIVGAYFAPGENFAHGFLRRGGEVRTLDFPRSGTDTFLTGIDDAGIISGTYAGFSFGLLAVPLDGSLPAAAAAPAR